MHKTKKQAQAVPTSYDKAETVEELANRLIAKYHPHLANVKIAYLYKNKDMTSNGKTRIASAEKLSPKVKALADFDFLIVISYPAYNALGDKQKRAVIDHELEHCWVEDSDSGDTLLRILPHDVEEFGAIIQRHGLYFSDLERLGRIVKDTKEEENVVQLKPHREGKILSLKERKRLKKKKRMKEESFLPE